MSEARFGAGLHILDDELHRDALVLRARPSRPRIGWDGDATAVSPDGQEQRPACPSDDAGA
ncbi:hypothetical protein PV396_44470 [Streptomyces sp. ME02-8801-2C]|uniref:hypothetical protein n=1 Tax=Streptomyces sp. ME02-8801-2C TaxID=3028680 RepID=UPI0029BF4883|nr:hypothetical protein [Streptomyces sp. ME02-8801-2C]MDX3458901.1 hypothetical protein [Streptomyces sp. ME02-8801-2C]